MNSVGVCFSSNFESFNNSGNWLVLKALVFTLGRFSNSNDVDVRELRLKALDGLDVGDSSENAEVISKLEIHGLLKSGLLRTVGRSLTPQVYTSTGSFTSTLGL